MLNVTLSLYFNTETKPNYFHASATARIGIVISKDTLSGRIFKGRGRFEDFSVGSEGSSVYYIKFIFPQLTQFTGNKNLD